MKEAKMLHVVHNEEEGVILLRCNLLALGPKLRHEA